jgi:hypothetical protein
MFSVAPVVSAEFRSGAALAADLRRSDTGFGPKRRLNPLSIVVRSSRAAGEVCGSLYTWRCAPAMSVAGLALMAALAACGTARDPHVLTLAERPRGRSGRPADRRRVDP